MSALKPLGFLYEKAAGLKNLLYDKELLSPVRLPIPVVSLGNLTMGGTGKTPLIHFCLQHYESLNIRTAVVSRNYRAEVQDIAKVDVTRPEAAAYFGDEPVLLAQKNPQASFFVGPEKFKTAQAAVATAHPQVVLVDDGFQHRRLARDLDLVILDATESWPQYRCLPEGRAREPWSSLERADAFLISKINLALPKALEQLLENLKVFEKPVVTFNFEMGPWYEIHSKVNFAGPVNGRKVCLVSGIARPQAFEKNLQPLAVNVVEHLRFNDHHDYKAADVEKIIARWKHCGEVPIVTTEKDAVKLKPLWPKELSLWVAPLEVNIKSGEETFYEILAQVLR